MGTAGTTLLQVPTKKRTCAGGSHDGSEAGSSEGPRHPSQHLLASALQPQSQIGELHMQLYPALSHSDVRIHRGDTGPHDMVAIELSDPRSNSHLY